MAWLLIAVGAEGVAETEGKPWIRPATEEEIQAFIAEREGESKTPFDLSSFLIDSTGRPYFVMAIDSEHAPLYVTEKVKCHSRAVRIA